jgi:hypothetical protein
MATITKIGDGLQDRSSHYMRRIGQYTGPAAYVAGGDSFTPESLGLGRIDAIQLGIAWNGSATRLLVYDHTNKKVVWYVPNTGAEASGDLSGYTARFEAIGK